MKTLLFVLALFPASSFAISYEIVGPCDSVPLYKGTSNSGGNAGRATIRILEENNIPYVGSEKGISSMLGTPVGDEAIERISDTEMRAYGWCFEVEGKQPVVTPDQVPLSGYEHIKWIYGFAHFYNGYWEAYCEPAYTVKPKALCH